MAFIVGNSSNNNLKGTGSDDIIWGFDGDDHLAGNRGDDVLVGGQGNDTIDAAPTPSPGRFLDVNSGHDTIYGGLGDDVIGDPRTLDADLMYGGEGNDAIFGGVSNDTILGGAGNDTVFGGRGDDLIYGNLGTDVLFGGEGNDYLFSTDQVSPDHLFGGEGNDTFDFRIQGGKTDLTADHVGDFTRAVGGADMVAVSVTGPMVYAEIAAASVTTVEQAIAAANPAIVDGANVVFVAGGADGYLVVDADGTGGLESTQDKVIVLDDFNNALLADPTMIIPIPIPQ